MQFTTSFKRLQTWTMTVRRQTRATGRILGLAVTRILAKPVILMTAMTGMTCSVAFRHRDKTNMADCAIECKRIMHSQPFVNNLAIGNEGSFNQRIFPLSSSETCGLWG